MMKMPHEQETKYKVHVPSPAPHLTRDDDGKGDTGSTAGQGTRVFAG